MRKLISLFAMVALTAAVALPAFAQTPTTSTTTQTTPAGPSAKVHVHWFAGTVTTVGSDSLSVGVLWTGSHDGSLNGQTVTVSVSSSTTITGAETSLSAIEIGDLVSLRAAGTGSNLSSLSANVIHVYCNCHWVGGTISAINGTSSLAVSVSKTGPYDTVLNGQTVTLGLTSSTVYIQGKAKTPIALSNLSNGESVGVVFSANGFFKAPGFNPATAIFTAKQVHAWPHRQPPSAASDSSAAAQTNV